MSLPHAFPFAQLTHRALLLAQRALRDAKRAAQVGDRTALKRARARAQKHAVTAQVFLSAAGPDHPDAATLADHQRRAAAALAGTLSLSLSATTPTQEAP